MQPTYRKSRSAPCDRSRHDADPVAETEMPLRSGIRTARRSGHPDSPASPPTIPHPAERRTTTVRTRPRKFLPPSSTPVRSVSSFPTPDDSEGHLRDVRTSWFQVPSPPERPVLHDRHAVTPTVFPAAEHHPAPPARTTSRPGTIRNAPARNRAAPAVSRLPAPRSSGPGRKNSPPQRETSPPATSVLRPPTP